MRTNPQMRTYLPSKASGVAINWSSETDSGCEGDEPGFSASAGVFPLAALAAAQPATASRKALNRRTEMRGVIRVLLRAMGSSSPPKKTNYQPPQTDPALV